MWMISPHYEKPPGQLYLIQRGRRELPVFPYGGVTILSPEGAGSDSGAYICSMEAGPTEQMQ